MTEDNIFPQAQEEETSPVESSAAELAVSRAIEQWIASEIRGSQIARHTVSYNHLMAKLPILSKLVVKELEA